MKRGNNTKKSINHEHNKQPSNHGHIPIAPRQSTNGNGIAEKLHESEQRFRLMFEQANVGIAFASLEGQIQRANQRYCDIVGYALDELLERSLFGTTHPDDIDRSGGVLMGEAQASPIEKRVLRKDGSIIWVNYTLSQLRDTNGIPTEYMAVVEDISERKKAGRLKAAHASQLEAILEAITDSVVVYDVEGHIMFASAVAQQIFPLDTQPDYHTRPAQERLIRYEARDALGQPLPPEQLPIWRILRGEVLTGANTMDIQIHTGGEQEVQFSVSGSPMRDAEGHIVGGITISRDVTEQRRLERRTHEALEGLLTMAEDLVQLPETADDIDEVGQRLAELTCNFLACQRVGILAIEPETEITRPIAVVGLSPEQESAWWAEQEQQKSSLNESPTPELVARLRAKEVVLIDMMQPPFSDAPNPYNIKVVLIAPMSIGERLIGLLTLDYGTVEHSYTPDEVALASAVAKLSALVLERQRLLHERTEAQGREVALREANRRMEEFLGIASHELRTPLTTIKANIQLTKRRLKATHQQLDALPDVPDDVTNTIDLTQDMLSRAERQVGVLNRLVGDLIDISRIQTGKLQLHLRQEPCDLAQVVSEVVQEQHKALPERTITLELPAEEAVPVIADPDRIAQVITNYLSNALKYSASDMPVAVRLEVVGQVQQEARLSVRDMGQGLSLQEQERIWECFYQAEGVHVLSGSGVGLGLGLYISQTIISRHGGQIGVQSTPGGGSTFWFTLPLAQNQTTAIS